MAESDVLAAIADVKDKVKDVKDKVKDLKDILDILMDPTKKIQIWQNCHKCKGDGFVLDVGVGGLDPTEDPDYTPLPGQPEPSQITCPVCNGVKRFAWGWQATQPEVTP
jgi:hypothetical protein